MTDFEGTLLQIGDIVVYAAQSYSSAPIELHKATVTGFTPKKVRLGGSSVRYPHKLFKVPC